MAQFDLETDAALTQLNMTAYAKNERENLSQSEIDSLQKIARTLVEMNRKRRTT